MNKLSETDTIQQFYKSILAEDAERENKILALQAERVEARLLLKGIAKRLGITLNDELSTVLPEVSATNPASTVSDVPVAGMSRKDQAISVLKELQAWLPAKSVAEKAGLDMSSQSSVISLYPILNDESRFRSYTREDGIKVYGLREWELPNRGEEVQILSGTNPSRTIGDVVEKILTNKQPQHAEDLVKQLAEQGIKNNKRNLSDLLSRDKKERFKNLGGNTWTLKEIPVLPTAPVQEPREHADVASLA